MQAGCVFISTHLVLNGFGDTHFTAIPHHSVTKFSCVAGIIYTCEHIELCECVCVCVCEEWVLRLLTAK